VSRIEEFVDPGVPVGFLLPDLPAGVVEAHRHWLAPRFLCPDADAVDITMQSWLLRTRHHTILVDTCGGNHKPREHFPVFHQRKSHAYLDNLRAAGVAPEDIDFVFCTHLHIDHVGWNTRLDNGRWVPTFRVRAICGRRWNMTMRAAKAMRKAPSSTTACCPWWKRGWRIWSARPSR
jgi:glyoxylase-like metal-dependent hydrolase (beta-lactamase superfamily II)